MKEADFQTRFGHWLSEEGRKFFGDVSVAFELKFVIGTMRKSNDIGCRSWPCLSFQRVAPHQEAALVRVEDMGLYWKISDMSFGAKPFDCFWLAPRSRGYLVIGYWMKGSGVVEVLFVRIEAWLALKGAEVAKGRRSVKREDLEAVAERVEWM